MDSRYKASQVPLPDDIRQLSRLRSALELQIKQGRQAGEDVTDIVELHRMVRSLKRAAVSSWKGVPNRDDVFRSADPRQSNGATRKCMCRPKTWVRFASSSCSSSDLTPPIQPTTYSNPASSTRNGSVDLPLGWFDVSRQPMNLVRRFPPRCTNQSSLPQSCCARDTVVAPMSTLQPAPLPPQLTSSSACLQ
ncbi:hypothetical protein OC846_006665 [Tilletia horrida]|uniref:Uncharacterized protein n=1 Tax=Tilletia horrida TaxID=155126 RepID=A0AAN6GKM4_9BASI|nr:hypothetical protein OC846_006665 [Tilletia horrida]KAK0559044.1 hypothetical protein OC861_006762 [Tilletia horrida]